MGFVVQDSDFGGVVFFGYLADLMGCENYFSVVFQLVGILGQRADEEEAEVFFYG